MIMGPEHSSMARRRMQAAPFENCIVFAPTNGTLGDCNETGVVAHDTQCLMSCRSDGVLRVSFDAAPASVTLMVLGCEL